LTGCEADLICVGHTHTPMEARVDGMHVVNVGSVSNPRPPDLRACYAILRASGDGYRVEHRRVEYDRAAVTSALEQLRHPGASFIARHMRGEI
jgi:predicted phosphodiesterase